MLWFLEKGEKLRLKWVLFRYSYHLLVFLWIQADGIINRKKNNKCQI